MADIILTAFIISGFAFLTFSMMMVHEVRRRGVKVNFWLIRLYLIKHIRQYKELNRKETGRSPSFRYSELSIFSLRFMP